RTPFLPSGNRQRKPSATARGRLAGLCRRRRAGAHPTGAQRGHARGRARSHGGDLMAVAASGKNSQWLVRPGQLLMVAVLLLLVVISALSVIYSTHRSRTLFNELQQLQRQEWALDEEWERLLLEQSTWGAHERVNQIAETKLDMVLPDPAAIRVMTSTPAAPGSGQ